MDTQLDSTPKAMPVMDRSDAVLGADEISLSELFSSIARGWKIVLVAVIMSTGTAVWLSANQPLVYRAEMRVTPLDNDNTHIAGGTLTSLLRPNTPTNFNHMLQLLHSRRLAQEIMSRPELSDVIFNPLWQRQPDGTWVRTKPYGLAHRLKARFLKWFGIKIDDRPSVAIVENFLAGTLTYVGEEKSDVVTISVSAGSPELATNMLENYVALTDGLIRKEKIKDNQAYLSYLAKKIENVTLAEHRVNLITLSLDIERQLMSLESNRPVAMQVLDPAQSNIEPFSPTPIKNIFIGIIAGGIIGVMIATMGRRKHRGLR
ncbi:MAG: hypothetical protein HQL37_00090 [Alphaproteobacteria bacterium]|nr:hypothetical protein [Alphaproteobacteria bacterium]